MVVAPPVPLMPYLSDITAAVMLPTADGEGDLEDAGPPAAPQAVSQATAANRTALSAAFMGCLQVRMRYLRMHGKCRLLPMGPRPTYRRGAVRVRTGCRTSAIQRTCSQLARGEPRG